MPEMSAGECAEILEEFVYKESGSKYLAAISYAASILRKVERGELREVVHAEWIEKSSPRAQIKTYVCSHCKIAKSATNDVRYCPHCGALMDGGEKHA